MWRIYSLGTGFRMLGLWTIVSVGTLCKATWCSKLQNINNRQDCMLEEDVPRNAESRQVQILMSLHLSLSWSKWLKQVCYSSWPSKILWPRFASCQHRFVLILEKFCLLGKVGQSVMMMNLKSIFKWEEFWSHWNLHTTLDVLNIKKWGGLFILIGYKKKKNSLLPHLS